MERIRSCGYLKITCTTHPSSRENSFGIIAIRKEPLSSIRSEFQFLIDIRTTARRGKNRLALRLPSSLSVSFPFPFVSRPSLDYLYLQNLQKHRSLFLLSIERRPLRSVGRYRKALAVVAVRLPVGQSSLQSNASTFHTATTFHTLDKSPSISSGLL